MAPLAIEIQHCKDLRNSPGVHSVVVITMSSFIARVFLTAFGLWMADQILSGVSFDSAGSLWIAALLLGIVNAIVRPVVFILTLPITLLTLGLFVFVLNGAMVLLVDRLMPSFQTDSLGTAILASIIVSLTGWAANVFIGKKEKRTKQ
jgi:putative membrane protein